MQAITRLLSFRKRMRRDESGSIVVGILMLAIIMFPLFGIGFDIMRATWLKASLQNDLDAAVSAAAATVYVDPFGQIRIDNREPNRRALTVARETYAAARAQYGGMGECIIESPETCWYEEEWDVQDGVLTYRIWDQADHWWGNFWDDDGKQVFLLESSAVLRGVNEQKYD